MSSSGGVRRSPVWLALVAAVLLGLFVAVYVATVRVTEGRLLDDAALRGAMVTNTPLSRPVARILDVISVASLIGVVALVAVIALVRLARLPGLVAIGVLAASNVSTLLLKDHLLSRPDLDLSEVTPATLNSLPSGHTTAAFSAVVALLVVLPPRWRGSVAVAGAVYAAATALATMSAGWHRAGDAVAAFLLVGVWGVVAALVLALLEDPSDDPDDDPGASAAAGQAATPRVLVVGARSVLPVAGLIALILTLAPSLRSSRAGEALALLDAVLMVAGTVSAVLVALLFALRSGPPPRQPT